MQQRSMRKVRQVCPEASKSGPFALYLGLGLDEFETLEWKNTYLQATVGIPVEVCSVEMDSGRVLGRG